MKLFWFVMLFPLGIFKAYVLTVLWLWFIVPQFGAKPLPLVVAWGLLVTAGLLHPMPNKTDKSWEDYELFFWQLIVTLIAWGMGAIGHMI